LWGIDKETNMDLKTIALAGVFALSSTLAFAQAGGASGSAPAMPESSGNRSAVSGTNTNAGGTVGTGMRESGMNGAASKPGGRDESKPGGQSTARKPSGS
jgi:hypothetical protein